MFNDDLDYMFRSYHAVAQIPFDMDQEVCEYPLQAEEAYFDGSHLR